MENELFFIVDVSEGVESEILDHRPFYAAHIFDQAEAREQDITTVIELAKGIGHRMRYWWLSDAMPLQGYPDRLIVCVHHPSSSEDAGMDLYYALSERGVNWDDLEAAALDEYHQLGKPVEGLESVSRPGGDPLFPVPIELPLHTTGIFSVDLLVEIVFHRAVLQTKELRQLINQLLGLD